jgi:ATP-binding cassette subfamily F protein uup
MALVSFQNVSLSFGGQPVLDQINLQIEAGERVCLIGRNGTGKTSLMRLLSREITPDKGRIVCQHGIRTARLGQEIPVELPGTVYEVVAGGLGSLMGLLANHHQLTARLTTEHTPALLDELASIENELAMNDGWNYQQKIETALSPLGISPDLLFADLSGGMKRRVLLARALACDPDLLLLDEPTNHLDIEAINWLQDFLLNSSMTILFVTHDRELLKAVATRILDLDRGTLDSWPGDYQNYLRRKEERYQNELNWQEKFDKKMAKEETWIRQGIKARRTRDQGRVRALLRMRQQYQERRQQLGQANMTITSAGLSGKLVAVLKNVSYGFSGQALLKDVSTTILRGDKVGIIGPNGCGKTTLLRLILGELTPTTGTIHLGTNLFPAFFDQQRLQFDEEKSVVDNLADGNEFVSINGQPRHVIGYLSDFLFAPDRCRSPVKILSGGERNRLLLAKIFAKPASILVLDEPTNDLDVETLELLEELLLDFKGTILLVSHDRAFLNNVATSTLVFEGHGVVGEYAGGYDDWIRQRQESRQQAQPTEKERKKNRPKTAGRRKLNFNEQNELAALPGKIEAMEREQQELYKSMADPLLYQKSGKRVAIIKKRLDELEKDLPDAYTKWQDLEGRNEKK